MQLTCPFPATIDLSLSSEAHGRDTLGKVLNFRGGQFALHLCWELQEVFAPRSSTRAFVCPARLPADKAPNPSFPPHERSRRAWLPILLSAVFVFIVSSLIHMVFKWHAPDYGGLANEDAVRDAIRAGNPSPGCYVLPYCKDMKDSCSEPMVKKYNEGPVGFLTVVPNGPHKVGRSLAQWFVLSLAISAVAAILAGKYVGLAVGGGRSAFYLVGIACFLGYGFGSIQEGIWKGEAWSTVAKFVFDAALYAAVSALTFWWLWP